MHVKLIDGQNLLECYKIRTNECTGLFIYLFPLYCLETEI